MLHLSKTLDTLAKDFCQLPNLTSMFGADDLAAIGNHIWEGYDRDCTSRLRWLRRTEAAMDLATQVVKAKSFPWANASNVAFPLVTIAALQFHARAYPAIIPGPDVVKYRVVGDDQDGSQKARALAIGAKMSYQVLEQDSSWEEDHDRLLIVVPIAGCAFKKSFYDGGLGHNKSELVLPRDLVMDYFAKSVDTARRKTHVMPIDRNAIYEGVHAGIYADVLDEPWYKADAVPAPVSSPLESQGVNKRTGQDSPTPDHDTPFTRLEQHCWLDLDGDGYAEPYIATIEASSKAVLRLVARWDRETDVERLPSGGVLRIHSREYFTKYSFIPSPDGGIYDLGFGPLLGPLNESVNSIVNQLIDAGTVANTAGGFLARGAKIRGGAYQFSPFGWQRVDSTGDDLRKSIFPLPVREPSAVLFNLLSLLIDYTNRVSGATETMVGENPGQNTPAETSRTMVEQGMKIYSAIFKRIWRSMKEEFKKLYILNAINLPIEERSPFLGDPDRVVPVADPNVTSESQRLQQAMAISQRAMSVPGYDIPAVERNLLCTLRVDGWETLYPGPDKVPPLPNPKMAVEQMKMQVKNNDLEFKKQAFMLDLQKEIKLVEAQVTELEARAMHEVAQAEGVQSGQQIARFDALIGAYRAHHDTLAKHLEIMLKQQELEHDRATSGAGSTPGAGAGRVPSMAGPSGYQAPPALLPGVGG